MKIALDNKPSLLIGSDRVKSRVLWIYLISSIIIYFSSILLHQEDVHILSLYRSGNITDGMIPCLSYDSVFESLTLREM